MLPDNLAIRTAFYRLLAFSQREAIKMQDQMATSRIDATRLDDDEAIEFFDRQVWARTWLSDCLRRRIEVGKGYDYAATLADVDKDTLSTLAFYTRELADDLGRRLEWFGTKFSERELVGGKRDVVTDRYGWLTIGTIETYEFVNTMSTAIMGMVPEEVLAATNG